MARWVKTYIMYRNNINLTEKEVGRNIYRVMSIDLLLSAFEKNEISLSRPSRWDDPFENVILNAIGRMQNGQRFTIGARDKVYGQCWTFTNESDAIWRLYAPNKNGVRIRSTAERLFSNIFASAGKFRDINTFIGKVKYMKKKEIASLFKNSRKISSWITDSTGGGIAESLLFKRRAFMHENELRIIHMTSNILRDDFIYMPINPFELIDDIVFDPRMDYDKFRAYKRRLRKLGFKERIVKSNLYRVPKIEFNFSS